MTYKDILKRSSTEEVAWKDVMTKELKSLTDIGSFEIVDRPRGAKFLQSTWVFKRKRYPDGSRYMLHVRGQNATIAYQSVLATSTHDMKS